MTPERIEAAAREIANMPDCNLPPAAMYDMPREVSRELADHEVFFSFNGDDQAIAFNEWWNAEGHDLFQKYLQSQAEGN